MAAAVYCVLVNSRSAIRPIRRVPSWRAVSRSTKSASWLHSSTSASGCAAMASSVRRMPTSTTFSSLPPDSAIGRYSMASSACTKDPGSTPLEALRKKSPVTGWSQRSRA